MDVLKFTLEGKFAFFKKPDVNTYLYFTYGNIHRVALLGMFGAILGYKGYNQMSFEKRYEKDFKGVLKKSSGNYPEFYERLKDLKIGIVPSEISITKKVQVFNNSVGYASQEQGGNLIVKEQWLENPSWDIYVQIKDEQSKKLMESIVTRSFVYIPYLGKNDHHADIKDVVLIRGVKEAEYPNTIHSLFIKDEFQMVEIVKEDDFDEDDITIFKYEEKLPFSLEEETNKYEFKNFVFTNQSVKNINEVEVYTVEDKNIAFI